jgi:outer membrane protein assembly factor BamB
MTTSLKSAGRITGMFLAVRLLGGVCFAQPAVTLSVEAGPPTTNVSVSGSGFAASAAIDIYFDTTNLALTVTNSSGSFSGVKIQVPASALPGTNWVTAVPVDTSDAAAQAPFKVRTNWAQFNFAVSHSGLNPYENILSASTAIDLGLRWSYSTGTFGTSSPVVANGVVYVGSWDNNVYALNASTGANLWKFPTGAQVVSSPTVANGVVYAGSADFNVYALSAGTGAKLGQFATGGAVYSPPAVAGGVVYVGSNDFNV